jgi:hypothetical protein
MELGRFERPLNVASPAGCVASVSRTQASALTMGGGMRSRSAPGGPASTVTVEDMAKALKQFPCYTVAAPPHGGKR